MAGIFGNELYNNLEFKVYINSYYYPLSHMLDSVATLKASDDIDIKTMEYGEYQPILAPLDAWPKAKGKGWRKSVSLARFSLKKQPGNVNGKITKWDELNDAIRTCFNSDQPIPMVIDVTQKEKGKPDADEHDIKLDWEYAQDDPNHEKPPTLLKFTMVCPFDSRAIPQI